VENNKKSKPKKENHQGKIAAGHGTLPNDLQRQKYDTNMTRKIKKAAVMRLLSVETVGVEPI